MGIRPIAGWLALLIAMPMQPALARLDTDAPSGADNASFYRQLRSALRALEQSEAPHFRQLYAAVARAPGTVSFRQMTDDPATWSSDGDPERGHTEPADGRPKREGRTQPTGAIVYLPLSAVTPDSARWKSGLLVHELVHALDLVTGRYHRDYTLRERRAVFAQNAWRQHVGSRLRTSYHGRFPTLDYQYAWERGIVPAYWRHLFDRGDFPPAPD